MKTNRQAGTSAPIKSRPTIESVPDNHGCARVAMVTDAT